MLYTCNSARPESEAGLAFVGDVINIARQTLDVVTTDMVQVNVWRGILACTLMAYCVAFDIGSFKPAMLSTLPRPTMDLVMPYMVLANVGLACGAFKSTTWL